MAFAFPRYTRGQVDRAGNSFRDQTGDVEELIILENWRASHLYVINTFQANLRLRRKASGEIITIAQRLKRRPTIIDKLQREPDMSLSRMHDIAGCRLIFQNVEALRIFRDKFQDSKAKHELVGGDDRYNYIVNPKPSGYRGVHDVYKYVAYSSAAEKWNKLRIELQYRTIVQHAWATAVEIVDLVNMSRLKFSDADQGVTRQFLLASELLARSHEDMLGPCGDATIADLIAEFKHLENTYRSISRLRELSSSEFGNFARSSKLFVLVNFFEPQTFGPLAAYGYPDNKTAVESYERLEQEHQGRADVVLVGASEQDAVKLAYTNYFSDASIFLGLIDQAMQKFGETTKVGPRSRGN